MVSKNLAIFAGGFGPVATVSTDEVSAAQGLLHGGKLGHFLAAGCAPGGPEIQDDDFALIIRQAQLGAVCM